MPAIVDFPTVVQEALVIFGELFDTEPARRHFAEYLTGLIVAENKTVAPQLTVVTRTIARSGVAVSVKDALAASVVPSETAAHGTTAVRASSSYGR